MRSQAKQFLNLSLTLCISFYHLISCCNSTSPLLFLVVVICCSLATEMQMHIAKCECKFYAERVAAVVHRRWQTSTSKRVGIGWNLNFLFTQSFKSCLQTQQFICWFFWCYSFTLLVIVTNFRNFSIHFQLQSSLYGYKRNNQYLFFFSNGIESERHKNFMLE
jgi:hypothetical protein